MASQTHPLHSSPPCPTSNGSTGARGGQPAGSPKTGDTRLKPPVGPKPRTLPKPAIPAKPCTPPPSPGSRPSRLEFPSAQKINLLAGPKPYGGSSTALKRLSFGLKSPSAETSTVKGAPPPAARALPCTTEEKSLAPVTPPAGGPLEVPKGATLFKVKPVPVVAKPERFPGTTVEEILAKMEHPRKEGPGSPDLAWGWRSTFSPDSSSHFGPKSYAAFWRHPSAEGGEGDAVTPGFEASWESGSPKAQESRASCGDKPVAGRMKREGSPSPIGEHPPEPPDGEAERDPGTASRNSGSSPASTNCDGDQSGHRKPPSPPGFSLAWTCPIPVAPAELSLGVAPGTSAGLAQAPGSPILPAKHPVSAPGSPAVPVDLPALGSTPTHNELPSKVGSGFPGTPESLAKIPIGLLPAPGAPDAPAEPCCRISRSLGSLEVPGEGSPPPSRLPEGLAPGTPDASTELPHSPPAVRALSPGPPDALARLPPSPPAEQPLAPGPTDAPARLSHSPPAGQAIAPGSPDTPARFPHSPTEEWALAPGAHHAPTELTHSPPAGKALAPAPPNAPAELPPRITHSPGAPEAPVPSPETPNLCPKLPTRVSRSPGSPEGPTESLVSSCSPPSPERGSSSPLSDAEPCAGPAPADESLRCPQLGLRRSSDGVVQLPDKGLGMGVLGGSLAALPRGGPPHFGPPLEGESNWALSQSFEWAFPSRTAEWEPPRSPIREADDSGLSEQGDSDGEGLAPTPKGSEERSSSERLDWQDPEAAGSSAHLDGAMGAPSDQGATEVGGLEATCLGGPVAETELSMAELKGPAVVDEAGTIWEEQGRPLLGAPLRLTELKPGQERAAPILLTDTPRAAGADRCQEDNLVLGLVPVRSCQEGPRPGEEGSEPHPNAHWLDELLASPPPSADETKRKGTPEPRDPAGPEDLLGWSRKDLCSEFGIRGAHRAGEFGWATEPGTGKTDWPGSYRASETEQDREFGTGTQDWSGAYKETELLGDSSVGHGNWPDAYGIGDSCRKEGEFSPGKPDWSSQYSSGGADSQGGEFSTRKLDWTSTYGIGDGAQQDNRFSTSKPDWTPEYSVGDTARQDRDFGTMKPDLACEPGVGDAARQDREFGTGKLEWTHEHGVGDTDQQDREFGTGKSDWTRQPGVGDTAWQDREFGTSEPDWTYDHGGGDTDQADREFGTSEPDWINMYGADTDQQNRELGTSKPGWTLEHGVGDTDQQDRKLSTSKLDWTREYGISDTDHQGKEFGAGKPAWTQDCSVKTNGQSREWTCEYGVGNTTQQDKPDWTREFRVGDGARQDRAFSPDKPAWLGEYGIHHTDRESAFGSGVGDFDSTAQEPGARKPGWNGNDWQESKFPFARRDCASDFRIRGAEHESQFGVIGTERAGGFGLSALDPSGAVGTLSPAELGERRTDWAGYTRTVNLDEPREAGVGQSDWTQELGLSGTDPSVSLGAISPEEPSRGWMDWTNELSVSSVDFSSSLGVKGSDTPREPGVGQLDGASDLGPGGPATATGFESVGQAETRVRQTDWSRELGSGDEGSAETREAGAGQMDWASEVGIVHEKQTYATAMAGLELHGDSSGFDSPPLSGPSSLLEEMLAKAAAQRNSIGEERGPPPAPDAHAPPSPQEEYGGSRPKGDGAPSPSDAMDGGWLPTEARRLSQPGRHVSEPSPPGEDFAFLEDMEVLDSAIYRSRANLGRKRGHRAPATRPTGSLGLSEVEAVDWMFRDSTEPRTVRWASSDEEVAEEPQSRRARPSPVAKGMKVPLFPGLNPSALKAKLRGRNRSAEEGAQLGEAKPTTSKEPHVQRSKSCKIPGVGGKPLVLPPKPEKSSGSDAASPHWLQVLKLKKKKS
ncbi:182 kDa tankyrase-1-binding protein isoform X1 [Chelonoidis abingdonii]|uniref:182 kDa tankyrase-1-binding protein isoform X1 n=1 Tax=Chelonoidis abingdonii TaxID=106734 RepID=UPI0013F1FCBA|nr:182 kDa tankyrase-1-binding protein isoform X1 [Chelonoidis abingdonii]XP_032641826.1 182 kDa tankyrase-1-binding protein isoform X1 [Chelonoidis abingdonii]XP_032641827.1 182 kDa tankyrase-1-binding protein isoform X1 [Chelonoidis abingdonii]XP_032641828.1 182 kDa tankyrase-1-binding protein isoform X1 [Chelonoidis abingdonii]